MADNQMVIEYYAKALSDSQLAPSKGLLNVLNMKLRPPLLWDRLREIREEAISLEIQNAELRRINLELVHRANKGKIDAEIPF